MKASILIACITSALAASSAPAALIFGLTSSNSLVRFDSSTPGSVTSIGLITGATVVDLDFSPANDRLYGITSTGDLYFINTATGAATLATAATGGIAGTTDFDFNPIADRARVYASATDQNFRLVPDASAITAPQTGTPGAVIADGTFTNTAFNLVANAYTNNFDSGTGATTLYSIDTSADQLIIHSVAPQFNTVAAVGSGLGVTLASDVGFDLGKDGLAYLSSGSNLYTVDLGLGTASSVGAIGIAGVTSIAVAVPEPSHSLLALSGFGCALLRRRRRAASSK